MSKNAEEVAKCGGKAVGNAFLKYWCGKFDHLEFKNAECTSTVGGIGSKPGVDCTSFLHHHCS